MPGVEHQPAQQTEWGAMRSKTHAQGKAQRGSAPSVTSCLPGLGQLPLQLGTGRGGLVVASAPCFVHLSLCDAHHTICQRAEFLADE
jgi:hypothetical protein